MILNWFSQIIDQPVHEELKELTTILILVVRSYSLDFDIKLGFDLEIELCEDINDLILGEYSLNSHIADKIICESDKIVTLILWDRKWITNVRMNKIKRLLWLNSLFSEYLLFHLLFLSTGQADWLWLLFCLLWRFVKFNFQDYLLNIFDIINIEMI